ncbi:MAG: S-layer homology domain-containing protein [Xanthomonadales bacterium]|nr:S-layer homology domain-containing protein [Xanthomonadales bacterium]
MLRLILILLLAVASVTASAQTEFTDLPRNHWARPFVDGLVRQSILSGYSDGTFRPNTSVTRAEFAAMLSAGLNLNALSTLADRNGNPPFTDINGHWARESIILAWRKGFLSGYADNTFRPAAFITRVEAYASIAGGLALPAAPDSILNRYTDQAQVAAWARPTVARAVQARLPATGSGSVAELRPSAQLTRAEAAVALYQARVHDRREIHLHSSALQGSCTNDAVCAMGQVCNSVGSSGSHRYCTVPTRASCTGCNLPILMYHDVVESNPRGDEVSRAQFDAQLRWLTANNYQSLNVNEALRYLATGVNPYPGKKPVLITFDDGYIGNYTIAFPLLRTLRHRAVFFVHTDFVGVVTSKDHLDWNEIREVEQSGVVEVHSHTETHPVNPPLNQLSFSRIDQELRGAMRDFLNNGKPGPLTIAYPLGSYNDTVKQVAGWYHRAGFRVASAPARLTADPLALPRIGINSSTTISQFAQLLQRAPID